MNDAQTIEALSQLAAVLWMAALAVLVLASLTTMGYLRNGERASTQRTRAVCGIVAALVFGTSMWGAMLLGIGSEGAAYPIGLPAGELTVSWGLAVVGCAIAFAPLLRWTHAVALVAAGVVVSGVTLGVRMMLLAAIDPRPGFDWSLAALLLGTLTGALGAVTGLWVGLRHGRRGRLRRVWRWIAALALGGTMTVAQELTLSSVSLASQKLSAHALDVPLGGLCVAAALLLPAALLLLQLDLHRRTLLFEGEKREERLQRQAARKSARSAA